MAPVCSRCGDRRGWCARVIEKGVKWMKNNRFSLRLGQDFKRKTIIPCFARREVLRMLQVPIHQNMMVEGHLETKEGFNFSVLFKNEEEHTFFGCPGWRGLGRAYGLEPGSKIEMYILGQPELDIMVHLPNDPVLPPSYFNGSAETRSIVDRRHVTAGTTLSWQELHVIVRFVAGIKSFVEEKQAGPYDGSYVPFVHTLNTSNVKKPLLKLPRAVVPEHLPASGDMRVIVYDDTDHPCTYSMSREDGCLIVNGWKEVCDMYKNIEVGDKIVGVLHVGQAGPVLFLHTIALFDD